MAPKRVTQQQKGQKRSRSGKEIGESSSSSPRVPLGLNIEDRMRFREIVRTKVLKSQCILDWKRLDEYGLVPAMRRLLRDEAWLRLFSMEERPYEETTLVFLATFKTRNKIRHARMANEVTFFAFGHYHTMSMKRFIGAMGLYTREELDDPEFPHLRVDLPIGVTSNDVWSSLTQDQTFEASRSKSSSLTFTSHRVFHYLQVRTLNSKMESPGTVTVKDIPPLYSVTQPYRVNLGVLVADAIRHQAGVKNKGVYIGGMITRILKNLQLWPESKGPTDLGPKPKPLPRDPFSQWNTPKVTEKGFDVEAPGVDIPPHDTAHFSAENLARLEKNHEELKRNQEEFRRNQETIIAKQNGMIELLKTIANHFGCAIPTCLTGSPPREARAHREEGETSEVPVLPPPLPEYFPPLNKKELARGIILAPIEDEAPPFEEEEEEEEDDGDEGNEIDEGDEDDGDGSDHSSD